MIAELAVLGASLCDPQAYWRVADLLTAEDFAEGSHARLYSMIAKRAREGSAFDAVTIGEVDPELGNLALDAATAEGWRVANVRAYAEQVSKAAVTRRVKAASRQIFRLDGQDILGEAQRLIGACAPNQTGSAKHIREYLRDSVTELQKRVDADGALIGVTTGMPQLDKLTCGWQAGDLIILAARPSVGKTALAVQWSVAAARSGKQVLFMSLEMTGVQLVDRIQAHVARVNANGLRDPSILTEVDFGKLFAAATEINDLPIMVDETSGLTVDAICARVRQVHAVTPLGVVFIDYLTQIKPPKANSTADALQEITRTLKSLAKELGIPIVLLSQLNREGAKGKPDLSNLRSSGAIEQDADTVVFIHRPNDEDRLYSELVVGKQRNGECTDYGLDADLRYMTFTITNLRAPAVAVRGIGRIASNG